MPTTAQTIANRANAQLSTGPRTTDGKTRVSQNAVRHGLTAKHLVIREDEVEEFTSLQDSLMAELAPQGALETILFHELLHAAWNLHRFRRIEAEASSGKPIDLIHPETTVVLDRLARYQARSQRAFYKALRELQTLQANRPDRDVARLTKQTQTAPRPAHPTSLPQPIDAPAKLPQPIHDEISHGALTHGHLTPA